jgi:hypothetical protein
MRKSLLLLWLAGCSSAATVDPGMAGRALRAWHDRMDSEPLVRVEITPVSADPDLFAALCDVELDWWGYFGVYHLTDGRVDWQAEAADQPDEQSIHRIRTLRLPNVAGPVIEVLGKTHLGNGSLYLYELRGRRLSLLLKTKAVDFNADVEKFRDGVLHVEYRDENGDGADDVVLSGVIEEWAEQEDVLVGSHPCRYVFLWDRTRGRFR